MGSGCARTWPRSREPGGPWFRPGASTSWPCHRRRARQEFCSSVSPGSCVWPRHCWRRPLGGTTRRSAPPGPRSCGDSTSSSAIGWTSASTAAWWRWFSLRAWHDGSDHPSSRWLRRHRVGRSPCRRTRPFARAPRVFGGRRPRRTASRRRRPGHRPDATAEELLEASLASLAELSEQFAKDWSSMRGPDEKVKGGSTVGRVAGAARGAGFRIRRRGAEAADRNRVAEKVMGFYLDRRAATSRWGERGTPGSSGWPSL